jgi:sugar phosphate permease
LESAMKNKDLNTTRKWASLVSLIFGAGTIYKLGFLKDAFYVPMQQFMNLSHTQIGLAMSVAGFISTFGFLASIYLSDRFSKKIMIPISLIGTGAVGLLLSTLPSFNYFLIAYCLLAIFADMLFWPIMLKTVRLLGDKSEQGRMFGLLEAGRGLIDTIVAFGALGIFAYLGSNANGLKGAILFFSVVPIIIGIISYFLLDHDKVSEVNSKGERVGKNKVAFEGMTRAIKNKYIWIVAFNVFFVYSAYCGITYFTPFLEDIYGLPLVLLGAYGIIKQYGLKMLGGPVGGYLTDKVVKSATKFLKITFLLTAIVMLIYMNLPHESLNLYFGMFLTLVVGAFIFSMRAVFFAPMEEIKVPREITGSAMSLGSLIGYLPGAFLYTVYGNILDTHPGMAGYKIVFSMMTGFAILGFLLSSYLLKSIKKMDSEQAA